MARLDPRCHWISDSQRVDIERETGNVLVCIFAGLFSQQQWHPHPDLQAWSSDERGVAELLEELDESPVDKKKRVAAAKQRATSSVEAWWPEIKRVSEALIDQHKFSTDELLRLLGQLNERRLNGCLNTKTATEHSTTFGNHPRTTRWHNTQLAGTGLHVCLVVADKIPHPVPARPAEGRTKSSDEVGPIAYRTDHRLGIFGEPSQVVVPGPRPRDALIPGWV